MDLRGSVDLLGLLRRSSRSGATNVNLGSGFFLLAWQPNQSAKVHRWLEHHLWSAYMCDYSLHAVANRPAEVAETLVTTKFRCSGTRGFASPTDSDVAVCLRPGTEIAFEKEAQTGGLIFRKNIGDRLARFRQINLDKPAQHHDALEFSNGAIVLVTNLASGQRAKVLQLPAKPMRDAPPSLARAAAERAQAGLR